MPKIKVRPNGQVKIPTKIAEKYHLKEGDTLDVRDLGGGIIFIPEKMKKKLIKELNDRLWDKMEEEADEAISKGEVIGPLDDIDEALNALKTSRV